MPNTIRHKRGTTTPAAASLVTGELAINTSTGAVFTKTDAGTVVNIGSGGVSWGGITGTLSSQTDLNSALGLKANLAGATFTGAIVTAAPTTAAAFLNLPHGAQPTTPNNGDVFTTTSGLFARINGSTLQYAAINSSSLSFGGTTLSFGTSAAASTIGVGTGATTTGVTKTVNIGTGALAGATTAVNIGSSAGTSTITLNGTVNATGLANGVKAWVNFNGTGTVAIRASFNVSSITDNGIGDYTVNFTTAMSDANYATLAIGKGLAAGGYGFSTWLYNSAQTTSAVRVGMGDLNSTEDAETFCVAVIR